jgi:eukaryotic-like serine/threonine-protein kinase
MAIQIGDILGDYQVTGVLGRGGMGKVFRVRSLLTDREEAMKIVLPDLDENPGLADRFLREIKVHASLQHPNIAALRTALRVGDRLVMILELVEGVSLEETIRLGPMEVAQAVGYSVQVLSALAFAHERGVIHRDIKPANILISTAGVVKLTDFGIARSSAGARLTSTGTAIGTLAYMSPEQVRAEAADGRSDLYSFGLTLYEMVTGRRAIRGETEHALMNAQLTAIPPEPSSVNPLIPAAVSAAIMRALAKDPQHRVQTASEFRAMLNGVPYEAPAAVAAEPPAAAIPAPEVADLERRLSQAIGPIARRIVPDAARRCRTVSELRQALAVHIENPKDRELFLRTSVGNTDTLVTRTMTPSTGFDPAALGRMSQALAPYLGPIADVLVKRTAGRSRSLEDLAQTLAAEIPSEADRKRFLAAVRSA